MRKEVAAHSIWTPRKTSPKLFQREDYDLSKGDYYLVLFYSFLPMKIVLLVLFSVVVLASASGQQQTALRSYLQNAFDLKCNVCQLAIQEAKDAMTKQGDVAAVLSKVRSPLAPASTPGPRRSFAVSFRSRERDITRIYYCGLNYLFSLGVREAAHWR